MPINPKDFDQNKVASHLPPTRMSEALIQRQFSNGVALTQSTTNSSEETKAAFATKATKKPVSSVAGRSSGWDSDALLGFLVFLLILGVLHGIKHC
jgi:hypothetical protein